MHLLQDLANKNSKWRLVNDMKMNGGTYWQYAGVGGTLHTARQSYNSGRCIAAIYSVEVFKE